MSEPETLWVPVSRKYGDPPKNGDPRPHIYGKYPSFFSLWLNFKMAQEGRFLYKDIYNYIEEGIYPENYQKQDKLALRKRAKYFQIVEGSLHYVGGKG